MRERPDTKRARHCLRKDARRQGKMSTKRWKTYKVFCCRRCGHAPAILIGMIPIGPMPDCRVSMAQNHISSLSFRGSFSSTRPKEVISVPKKIVTRTIGIREHEQRAIEWCDGALCHFVSWYHGQPGRQGSMGGRYDGVDHGYSKQ